MRPFILLFAMLLTGSGCKKPGGCTQYDAENYDPDAIVDDGSCVLVRDKFLGLFRVDSECFTDDYMRTISTTQNDYVVIISNLADTLGNVEARVYGNNIVIDRQSQHAGISIEGAGIYQENHTVSLSYRVRDSRSGTEIIHDCLELCSKL